MRSARQLDPNARGISRSAHIRRRAIGRRCPRLALCPEESRLEAHDDLDLEANEAFAAQGCAVNKDLGWDTTKGQRQRRRHRDRPSDRCLRCARAGDLAARDEAAQFQRGTCHALHRRRNGNCDVRGARLSRANMHRGTTRGALSAERHFWLMSRSTRTGLGCKKSFWEE
jgi:hypothetical protein